MKKYLDYIKENKQKAGMLLFIIIIVLLTISICVKISITKKQNAEKYKYDKIITFKDNNFEKSIRREIKK